MLIYIEQVVRKGYSNDFSFIGPTLASIGLGFILPLISLRKKTNGDISKNTIKKFKNKGFTIVKDSAEKFVYYASLLFLVSVAIWIWSLDLSINNPNDVWFNIWKFPLEAPIGAGIINYLIGMILTERWKRI